MSKRIVIVALLVLLVPFAAHAGYFWQADGGFFELQVDSKQKVPPRRVFFVWTPKYGGGATFEVFILCNRSDASGNPVGRNKYKVKNIAIGPTSDEVTVPKMSGRANKGFISREVPGLAAFSAGTALVAEATFQVLKKLNAGDVLLCRVDITGTP